LPKTARTGKVAIEHGEIAHLVSICTIDKAQLAHIGQEPYAAEQVAEYLHDFKEVVTLEHISA
jgi:hypothetical protein